MIITKKSLSRRTLLRGAGIGLALPFLDAMVPALTAMPQALPPRRLGFVYLPMGMNPSAWTPRVDGRITELSGSLQSLNPFLDRIAVITNLVVKNGYSNGNHATANSCFLSCARAKWTEGSDYELGPTVDQIAAKQIGGDAAIPSLELGTDLIAQVGNCDNGLACVYMNNLSWSSATTPLPTEADPRVVFERLFGDGGSSAQRRRELEADRSILDWATEDLSQLRRTIGPADRTRVGEYLDSVREVERRIQNAAQQNRKSPEPQVERPVSIPVAWEDHVKLMFDLQVLAFQADLTRVITFQLAREASTRSYPQLGFPEVHHDVSHHGDNPEKLAKLAKINAYHVSLFAYFLGKLTSTADGDGTLFEHTTYLIGSGMGNPNVHDHDNLPAVVAGGAAGRGGIHVNYRDQTPLANLHLALLDRVGVHLDSFVDSTGRVSEIIDVRA